MHFLKKAGATLLALATIGVVTVGIYFFPIIAVVVFLCCVVAIWSVRMRQGDSKRAWKELMKSLFLDW